MTSPIDPETGELRPSTAPEDHTAFRLAQLLLLFAEIAPAAEKGMHLERIGYYDFFAANPFAVVGQEDRSSRARLHHAAFHESQLSYASTGSRFANRRQRLQHDLAVLVAYGLIARRADGYAATELGERTAKQFSAMYAHQYRESVQVVHERLRRLSDTQLAKSARDWLRTPSLILDLFGVPSSAPDASEPTSSQPISQWGDE